MPAGDKEKTFYNIKRLHWIFAASSLILLATTVAMFVEDHGREWKRYQRRAAEIDVRTATWLQAAEARQDGTESQAERLERRMLQQRSTYFAWDSGFPWLGKRWLELPILDAFNSPRRIETLWAEDLTQDYHSREVLRYDRCTTCHQRIQTGWPGDANRPQFPPARTLTLQLLPPVDDPHPERSTSDPPEPEVRPADDHARIEQAFGLVLAETGLTGDERLTVAYVAAGSPASKAVAPTTKPPLRSRDEIEALLLSPDGAFAAAEQWPGLWMGDEIIEVDGQPVGSRQQWTAALLAAWKRAAAGGDNDATNDEDEADDASAADRGPGVTLTVRRGLVHPFASHPRLDLYVGASSPHPMSEFGCTVCHGGQGSATSFVWASHTPDSEADRGRWRQEHGWTANEFWLDPMRPARFAESACLKCHHHVVDLAASERFLQPPAAKLLRGYELILQNGCFGCHDMTGIADGRPLGPDLRVEPSSSAAEQEHPGTLRRPGPSLRHLAAKLDGAFVRQWLADPEALRPETRMPKSFGVLDHVAPELHAETVRREAVEMHAAAHFLLAESQPLEYLVSSAEATASTAEEQAARGRELFQVSGCLVCHKHRDFADADRFRGDPSVADGPDLSQLADRLRGPDARRWLTTWILDPTRHDPRTVMPAWNPPTAARQDAETQSPPVADPVADLVEYLLPRDAAAPSVPPEPDVDLDALDRLVFEHLKREFPEARAAEYRDRGIPMRLRDVLKTAERDLVVADEQQQQAEFRLDRDVKLRYLGRKTVAWYGCYGCHEIPGFENTKPIGIELNDWGRKDPRMLAFEHVADYVAEGLDDAPRREQSGEAEEALERGEGGSRNGADAQYYLRHLRGENRIGFLHQKLAEPRSFDYGTLRAKPWNDRLRMPQFRFTAEEREAVMTFVLGLVAQPPRPRYVHQPDSQQLAVLEGRKLLDQYNCRGCHALQAPGWQIEFPPETFPPQPRQPTFPFVGHQFSAESLAASLQPDRRGLLSGRLIGQPVIGDDGRPMVFDDYGDELFDDEQYDPSALEYAFQLWQPAVLEGHEYQVGETPLTIPAGLVVAKSPSDGGFLANYLLPRVVRREREANPNAKGSEAWGWLPPPLDGLGQRVQTPWLRNYLLDPLPMRPAAVMPMPRFALSPQEADRLARYFAAVAGVDDQSDDAARRNTVYLDQAEREYQQRSAELAAGDMASQGTRFDRAMQILVDKNYCITCHIVGDFQPQTSDRAKAPDLAAVHHRLRPEWLRRWIGKPVSLVPYTGMPVNIPFHPDNEHLGGVDQALYHGTSIQQVDAVVDLLLNFDRYAASRSGVSTQIQAATEPPP